MYNVHVQNNLIEGRDIIDLTLEMNGFSKPKAKGCIHKHCNLVDKVVFHRVMG